MLRPVRFHCVGVCFLTGLPCISMSSWPYVYFIPRCGSCRVSWQVSVCVPFILGGCLTALRSGHPYVHCSVFILFFLLSCHPMCVWRSALSHFNCWKKCDVRSDGAEQRLLYLRVVWPKQHGRYSDDRPGSGVKLRIDCRPSGQLCRCQGMKLSLPSPHYVLN